MTDTTITDAIVAPQDDGTGVPDGSEDYNSAAYLSAISRYKGQGSYVGEDESGTATLQFNDVDTTNEQVDVGTGFAYITESGNQVQSSGGSTYDTTLPVATPYVVILPTEVVDLGLATDTTNDLWLAIDTTANDSVYLRHGSGLSAPSDPNLKLGTVDTSTGETTRANDLASAPFQSANIDEVTNNNYVEPQVTASDGASYTADLSQANYHKVTLTGDVSFDFSNVDASDTNSVVLHLVQDSTGGRTPSFTPTVVWDGGSAPSWSTSANAEDVVTLINDQDGGQWLGMVGGLGMA